MRASDLPLGTVFRVKIGDPNYIEVTTGGSKTVFYDLEPFRFTTMYILYEIKPIVGKNPAMWSIKIMSNIGFRRLIVFDEQSDFNRNFDWHFHIF